MHCLTMVLLLVLFHCTSDGSGLVVPEDCFKPVIVLLVDINLVQHTRGVFTASTIVFLLVLCNCTCDGSGLVVPEDLLRCAALVVVGAIPLYLCTGLIDAFFGYCWCGLFLALRIYFGVYGCG